MAKYPSEYELDVALRDGGGARIRPIKPDDGTLLVEFFERLGPESRYFRFFRIKETLEPKEVEFFTNVDYSDRMALIAVLDGDLFACLRLGKGCLDRLPVLDFSFLGVLVFQTDKGGDRQRNECEGSEDFGHGVLL